MRDTHLPNLYSYIDFRKYLNDFQEAKKQQDHTFTRSAICQFIGLPNSRSYFTDVINGKRVTPAFVERFLRFLQLSKDEAQFFRVLVKYNQSEDAYERELYLDQLVTLNKTPKTQISHAAYEFYSKWHHTVIRMMLDVVDYKDDINLLTKNITPEITEKQAVASIALLKKLSLIEKDHNGFWRPSQKTITTGDFMQDAMLLRFQAQCLDIAKKALFVTADIPQHILTNTISISRTAYKRIEKYLDKFRSEVRSVAHKDEEKADRVYQLNIQLFPLSKIRRQEKV